MPRLPTRTDLLYDIVEQALSGAVDGVAITAHAVSGGRAGSKVSGVVIPLLANNPFATHVRFTGHNVGGPLPRARYTLTSHAKTDRIQLTPFPEDRGLLGARDGFLIHGRGPRGSDGCIVPTDFNVVQLLSRLVKERETAGRLPVSLEVISTGDFERFERMTRIA